MMMMIMNIIIRRKSRHLLVTDWRVVAVDLIIGNGGYQGAIPEQLHLLAPSCNRVSARTVNRAVNEPTRSVDKSTSQSTTF